MVPEVVLLPRFDFLESGCPSHNKIKIIPLIVAHLISIG